MELRKLLLSALALTAVALLIAGCGGGGGSDSGAESSAPPKHGGTLHFAQIGEALTLNQFTSLGVAEITTAGQITEPLFKTNKNEEVEPWLATSFEKSKDERDWTFHLRKGVKFSNGKPMTAADVVFTLETAKKSPYWGSTVEPVSKVRATSPSTVVVEADEPTPAMPAILSLFATGIVPKNFGGMSEKEFGQKPIGTGPFMVGKWNHGESLTLEANPNYWQKGRPYLDKVVFETVAEDTTRVTRLKGGELDVVAEPPWSQLTSIEDTPGLSVFQAEDGFTDYIIVNADKPLFKDPRAREAINLAVNRDDIVKAALGGYGKPAGSLAPLSLLYTDPNIKPPAQDVEKAKQLLKEAVEATGEKPNFTMVLTPGDTYARAASQIIQQNLREIGFEVKLEPSEAQIEALSSKDYDLGLLKIYSTIPDPIEFWAFYLATDAVFSGAPLDKIETLSTEAAHEIDPEKRKNLYYEIQKIDNDENFLVVLDDKPWAFGLSDKVSGFFVNALGMPSLEEVGFSE
ncbi:MAG TPA: ABC transporter substrate-binding protein [Solirubrobacterales bacterium]|nr:ABC transporter substrate-binding protein [Solirubrobacterales bacterium]